MQSKNRTRLFSDSGEGGRRGVATFRGRRHPPPCPRAAHSGSRREVSRRLRGKKAHRAFLSVACRCGMGTMAYLLQRSRVRRPVMLHAKRHPKWVPFCMELTSHQLGKIEPGIRFFRFSCVQPKQIWNHIIIYRIEAFYKIRFAIQEPVISLVRGHGK